VTAAPFPDSARLDPLAMVAYDPAWPARFDTARTALIGALLPWLVHDIEHIGSTAVPGLTAKPIIDMLAVVQDIDAARAAIGPLTNIGWLLAPQPDDDAIRRLSFCTPTPERRTHHLHVVEDESQAWRTWLAFRDQLRSHPDDAAAYGTLKTELAARYADDRAAYRAAKAPFIEAIVARVDTR
jgi:GrpB-like predicted nucleotidyltransferase (UPF0157 family)